MGSKIVNKLRILAFISFMVGIYAFTENIKGADMKTLKITWQRLVDEQGQTCERCGSTEKEVEKAFHNLEKSLAPLGITVTLEEKALDSATCTRDVSESNRIWIDNRPLEDWLGALVGESSCEFCCAELGSDVECRTVIHEGKTFETIPANLIIKAGLLAASQLLSVESHERCCDEKPPGETSSNGCCPKANTDSEEP